MTKVPGTYLLLLWLEGDKEIAIGRLGNLLFPRGYYLYVGSARGPGGLQSRLAHHCQRGNHPRWHIDYLRGHANLVEIWAAESDERWECLWAQKLARLSKAYPIPRFGSSDCRCPSHLFHFREKPSPHSLLILYPKRTSSPAWIPSLYWRKKRNYVKMTH